MSAEFEDTKEQTVEVTTTSGARKVSSAATTLRITRTHHVQWYDLTDQPTGKFIEQMEILSVQLVSQEFDPRGFPWPDRHAMPPFRSRVLLYASDPYEHAAHPTEADWALADMTRLLVTQRANQQGFVIQFPLLEPNPQ